MDMTMTKEEKDFHAKKHAWMSRILKLEDELRYEKRQYDQFLKENADIQASIHNKEMAKSRLVKAQGLLDRKERDKVLKEKLRPGDLVIVKTLRGNRCAEFVSVYYSNGFLCKKFEYPKYIYKNRQWVENPNYNPNHVGWGPTSEVYVGNSVIGRIEENADGSVYVERFK